ncbi:sugar-binding transcriptional regulator [Listeria booriae]|uniref:Sugar-binding transcriptional regulator n=1 Tax=Listeria booriae TaxID=1552123 RepID=A0A7X0YNV5_9LIST|nr:sugar-binding transcriptional regulator [Listeria booriae]MBC1795417.1 sugar-binding transcriptional regulator [Listeria booriae]MBC1799062.1 sugar-binding transcriptional regulator [Listeria booriae]MBC1802205.1 sugar-binding transcriptional regulator [Listeria booriae]MBC1887047.1 sugar-binding transcriptional regulator [Listeria booriae]MBC1905129.1 sugar-binding transcriptional regulator [Listeria booriae]
MSTEENRLLVRIAELYYNEDKTQSQIAKELNIHRSTISRLLKKSRENGIVKIDINHDMAGTYSIEKKFESLFPLQKVIIIPTVSEMGKKTLTQLLAKAANSYLHSVIKDSMIIGFSWGESMTAVASELQEMETENVVCVPMIGGPSGKLDSDYHVNRVVYEVAKKINAKSILIDSPAIPETVELKNALMNTQFNKELTEIWNNLDIAVFGVGSTGLSQKLMWRQFYGENVLSALSSKNVVGDVISRFFDENGVPAQSDLNNRTIGTTLEQLKMTKIRIGISESVEKAKAILGALRGEYINVLITTDETANSILELMGEKEI